ncbi:MAG: transporter [Spirochaetaceae bacterium]|nr:transporter [Spirochaetaceae bacterium]
MIQPLDLIVFGLALLMVLLVGWWAAWKESSPESGGQADDYFLAGRSVPWWSIAGSIFGTNVSAAHMVGMLGVGYSIGFAQAHYELGAILALFALCYLFLPVYRKMGLVTLSQFLEKRYGAGAGVLYSAIMLILIVVQLTAAFYIGSRSFVHLLGAAGIELNYALGVVLIAGFSALYTIAGGLKAVIYTDVLQTVLLIVGGLILAYFTFSHSEVGGWHQMMVRDASAQNPRMTMMLPSDHPDLPWTGALTGLLFLHFFYWGTNQYVVQRALAARSDGEARIGVLAGGFLKLLIPFMSIATGVAAAQLFLSRGFTEIAPDDAFPQLLATVVPAGWGLIGLIMAGLLAAILSTIDSMMNSASTLATVDLYKKYVNPEASDRALVLQGRLVVAGLMVLSILMAIYSYDPEGRENFFLVVSNLSSHFTPGILVAFFAGILFAEKDMVRGISVVPVILGAPLFSFGLEYTYNSLAGDLPHVITDVLGMRLNFLHRVMATVLFCSGLLGTIFWHYRAHLQLDLRSRLSMGFLKGSTLIPAMFLLLIYIISASGVSLLDWSRFSVACITSILVLLPFAWRMSIRPRGLPFRDDRLYAGLLFSLATFIFFRFF